MKTEVLIIGGGPTGLTMAALLARSGINFRIIDKGSDQARESRALGVQARTLELFHNIDLVDEFLKQGRPATGLKMFFRGSQRAFLNFSQLKREDTPYPYIFFISQAETEKILINDLIKHNVTVERQTSLKKLTSNHSSVSCLLERADGTTESVEATFVIGCDGAHSEVRHELGLNFQGGAYEQDFILADAKVTWPLEHDKLMIFLDSKNVGVHFPLKGSERSRILAIRATNKTPQTNETTSFPATLEEVEESFNSATHINTKLSDPVWVAKFRVHHRGVNHMSKGRVFVAGDAAHIHSPIGAQGMNTGIQDAANLAWKISRVLKGSAHEKILETYSGERLPVMNHLLNFTDKIFEFVVSKNPFIVFFKSLIVPVMAKILMTFNFGRKFLFGFVSQLEIRYHESVVVASGAGRRMPNFLLDDGNELFDLLKGYQFHLLVFEDKDIHLISADIKIHKIKAHQRKGMILVRPDGYIACLSDFVSADVIEKYFLNHQS